MKRILYVCLFSVIMILTSCTKPTPGFTSTPPPTEVLSTALNPTSVPTISPMATPTTGDVTYELDGITLVVPICLGVVPTVNTIPAVLPDPNAGPLMVFPEHLQVSFSGYPLHDKYFEPLIRVFPVEEFSVMSDLIAGRVTRMQELLKQQTFESGTIPLLPGYSAFQVFKAQVRFLNFQNGRGIRWLTELAQYSAAVNNRDLFYSYQGLTSDNKHWVSVMLPVNAAYLQETWDSTEVPSGGLAHPAAGSANMEENLIEYYRLMLGMLNNTPDTGFTPPLDCLDIVIQSIRILD